MDGLLKKLEENLLLKNYSKETIKSYLFIVGKYLKFSNNLGINQESAKKFVLKRLSKGRPASVSHDVFAIKYFFKEILKQELEIPNPKKEQNFARYSYN